MKIIYFSISSNSCGHTSHFLSQLVFTVAIIFPIARFFVYHNFIVFQVSLILFYTIHIFCHYLRSSTTVYIDFLLTNCICVLHTLVFLYFLTLYVCHRNNYICFYLCALQIVRFECRPLRYWINILFIFRIFILCLYAYNGKGNPN